jgi:hypothetical protein
MSKGTIRSGNDDGNEKIGQLLDVIEKLWNYKRAYLNWEDEGCRRHNSPSLSPNTPGRYHRRKSTHASPKNLAQSRKEFFRGFSFFR